MKNLLKIGFSSVLSLMIIINSSISVYGETLNQEEALEIEKQQLLDERLQDETFFSLYNSEYKEELDKVINDTVERRNASSNARIVSGSYAYWTVPIIKQATSIYCGFASMHQILDSLSLADEIDGDSDLDKQTTLKEQQNNIITSQGEDASPTGVVSYMSVVLNSYLNNRYYHWYYVQDDDNNNDGECDGLDLADFCTYTYNSLAVNRPTIMYTNTKHLSYYEGTSYIHYIVGDYIDYTHRQFETADCCWTDAYRGHFMVSFEEMFAATDGYHLICLSQ